MMFRDARTCARRDALSHYQINHIFNDPWITRDFDVDHDSMPYRLWLINNNVTGMIGPLLRCNVYEQENQYAKIIFDEIRGLLKLISMCGAWKLKHHLLARHSSEAQLATSVHRCGWTRS